MRAILIQNQRSSDERIVPRRRRIETDEEGIDNDEVFEFERGRGLRESMDATMSDRDIIHTTTLELCRVFAPPETLPVAVYSNKKNK